MACTIRSGRAGFAAHPTGACTPAMNGKARVFAASYVGSRVIRFTFPVARRAPLN
jgi:hypothetical protein